MNLTLKSQQTGLHIDASVLKELGIEGEVDVEIRREGQRLVVEASRGMRLQRLAEDLDRLMACGAEQLPHAR